MSELVTASNTQRDTLGLFKPGNTIARNGGNPNVKRQAEYKRALIACSSVEDVQKLYAALMAAAVEGDVQAAKLLLDHLVGRPSQTVEISGTDGDAVKFDMRAVTAVIATALADHPEAQYKLAAALRGAKLNEPDGLDVAPA